MPEREALWGAASPATASIRNLAESKAGCDQTGHLAAQVLTVVVVHRQRPDVGVPAEAGCGTHIPIGEGEHRRDRRMAKTVGSGPDLDLLAQLAHDPVD